MMETDYIWKEMMNKDIRYPIEDELYTIILLLDMYKFIL